MPKDKQLKLRRFLILLLESLKLRKSIKMSKAQEELDSHLLKVYWDYSNEHGDCNSGVTEWRYTKKNGIYSFTNVNNSRPSEHSSIEEFIDNAYRVEFEDSLGGRFEVIVEDEDGNVVYRECTETQDG